MHRWLAPGGLLINLQPDPRPLRLELETDGVRSAVGVAHHADSFHGDMRRVRAQLAEQDALGAFRLVAELPCPLEMCWPDVEGWEAFQVRPRGGAIELDEHQHARVIAALDSGRARLIAHVEHTASHYVRLPVS